MKPSRGWVITINNPVIPLDMYLQQWIADGNIVFGCGQTEHPPGGTKHHQAYIVTKVNEKNTNGFGIKWLVQNIHSHAHFEPRRGSHEEARDYCTLEEYKGEKKHRIAGPWTVGEWSPEEAMAKGGKKGNVAYKKNVADMFKRVDEGASDRELAVEFPHLWAQYYKALDRYRLMSVQDLPRVQPYIVVLHGPTGTGKSHKANLIMENNGGGFIFRKGNSGNLWADGYDPLRHPVVIFDEMDGSFVPYRMLLRICDKWQLTLDTKGGAVNFCPKIIIFTSSKHPKDWYSVEAVPDTTEMMRRLSGQYGAIINMTIPYSVVRDAGPDLADVLDLLETGDLVDQMRDAVEKDEIADVVDLTCDEVLDQLEPDYPDYDDVCDDCDRPKMYCECTGGHPDDYVDEDEGYIEYSPSQKYLTPRTSAVSQAPPAPRALKRQGAEFFITPPPDAPASEFKKLKLVPGQARLDLKKVNDDDDDIDDK